MKLRRSDQKIQPTPVRSATKPNLVWLSFLRLFRHSIRPFKATIGAVVLYGGVFTSAVHAQPHVVGYARFHSEKPTKEGGALLFSELACANCHGGSPVKISRKGPNLIDLGQRIERDWLVKFLRKPESGRKGSTMPSMLHGLKDGQIEAVVAFLGKRGKGIKFRTERHANAERGSALYHEKGCVACHAPTVDFKSPHGNGDSFDLALAISHPDLNAKTSLEALGLFLRDPSKYRVDGRMPHIQLNTQEAMDVAAHLMDFQASDPREAVSVKEWPKVGVKLVAEGKALVQKMNCAACHSIPEVIPLDVIPLKSTGLTHCLSSEPQAGTPHYKLTKSQRESLILFLEAQDEIEDKTGHLTLSAMNCYACHDRNGVGGPSPDTNRFFVGNEALGDSGRLPPPLTGIGHKLKRDWLRGALAGEPEKGVRPYLKTQMPAYAAHASTFADWFAKIDQKDGVRTLIDRPDDLEAGRKLLGINGGVNCITCHNWGDQKALGIPALDLSSLNERLQPSWFRSYLLNPAEYRPGTLMPSFWPEGHSSIKDVLEGDSERQIGAIWKFIKNGEGLPEGFANRLGGQFELLPRDRPIIQRTFLKKTGTKAILVGFPGEVHLAFDGDSGFLSMVWRGRFFDAYDTWFTRAAPFGQPLGDEVYEVPKPGTKGRFRGYELDEGGNPTFIVNRGGREFRERFSVAEGQLIREVRWVEGDPPKLRHPKNVLKSEASGENILTYTYFWK